MRQVTYDQYDIGPLHVQIIPVPERPGVAIVRLLVDCPCGCVGQVVDDLGTSQVDQIRLSLAAAEQLLAGGQDPLNAAEMILSKLTQPSKVPRVAEELIKHATKGELSNTEGGRLMILKAARRGNPN